MILVIHECNMKIVNELMLIFFQLEEKIELNNFISLFPFNKLREIFNIFKMNGFDYIHQIIIRLLKQIIIRKVNHFEENKYKKNLISIENSEKENFFHYNNLNLNEIVYSAKETEIDSAYSISNEDFAEINIILLNAIQFMKNKIIMYPEFAKSAKNVINFITNINFMFDSLITVIRIKPNNINIMQNLKLVENFINLVLVMNEFKLFFDMERYFAFIDPNLVNNKVLVLKMLLNIQKVTKILKEMNPKQKVK